MAVKNKSAIYCKACGYEQVSDEYGFIYNKKGIGKEIKYVSDWSRIIYNDLKEKIKNGKERILSSPAEIHTIKGKKFAPIGKGEITLNEKAFLIKGEIEDENKEIEIPIHTFASLPFSPGKYLEIQDGDKIYRCILKDGKLVMKFINMVKIFYEQNTEKLITK